MGNNERSEQDSQGVPVSRSRELQTLGRREIVEAGGIQLGRARDPRLEALAAVARRGRFYSGLGFAVILLFFGTFFGWSFLAPLQSAVPATGKVVVESNRQSVQPEYGGVIKKILHRDGDMVKKGDELVVFDETRAKAKHDLYLWRFRELLALQARLQAERDDAFEIDFPELLTAPEAASSVAGIIDGQRKIFETRRTTLGNEINILEQKIKGFQEEINGLRVQIASRAQQLKLIGEEAGYMTILLQKGLAQKSRVLALQRHKADLEGKQGADIASIARAKQEIGATKLEVSERRNTYHDEAVSQLRDTEGQLSDVREQLETAKFDLEQTIVRAPQDGVVVGSSVHTVGGFAKPGTTMMEIVPEGDKLIIEARIRPEDIDEVHAGLPVTVRLTGFNQRTTPQIDGTLSYVSADAFTDEHTNVPYYSARIEVNLLAHPDTANISLQPGMPASVMIVTGTRTLADYIVAPVMDGVYQALREG